MSGVGIWHCHWTLMSPAHARARAYALCNSNLCLGVLPGVLATRFFSLFRAFVERAELACEAIRLRVLWRLPLTRVGAIDPNAELRRYMSGLIRRPKYGWFVHGAYEDTGRCDLNCISKNISLFFLQSGAEPGSSQAWLVSSHCFCICPMMHLCLWVRTDVLQLTRNYISFILSFSE